MEKDLKKQFQLIKKIGQGGFGKVYLGKNFTTGQEVALKFELATTKQPTIYYEAKLIQHLTEDKGIEGIPKVFYCSTEQQYNILIMEYLGPSLEEIFQVFKKEFTQKTILMIGLQILERIENLHKKHFIHRDIKPSNFLIGTNKNSNIIYMTDFGNAKRYINRKGQHIDDSEIKTLIGTPTFCSNNALKCKEQSRRDDLESLAYMLIYFAKGFLPWANVKGNNLKDKQNKIREKKEQTTPEQLCKSLPEVYLTFLTACQELEFQEKPNYDKLQKLLKNQLKKINCRNDGQFDWNLIVSFDAPFDILDKDKDLLGVQQNKELDKSRSHIEE